MLEAIILRVIILLDLCFLFSHGVVCKATVIIMCITIVLDLSHLSKTGHTREVVEFKGFEHQTQTAPLYSCFLAEAYNFHSSNTVTFLFTFWLWLQSWCEILGLFALDCREKWQEINKLWSTITLFQTESYWAQNSFCCQEIVEFECRNLHAYGTKDFSQNFTEYQWHMSEYQVEVAEHRFFSL